MANTLLVTGGFTYTTAGITAFVRTVTALSVSVTGSNAIYESGFSVPTTSGGTVIPVSGLAGAPFGWAYFRNLDNTNQINILTALSGTVIISLLPGEFAVLRLGSGITAPAAIALTGACLLEFCIIQP